MGHCDVTGPGKSTSPSRFQVTIVTICTICDMRNLHTGHYITFSPLTVVSLCPKKRHSYCSGRMIFHVTVFSNIGQCNLGGYHVTKYSSFGRLPCSKIFFSNIEQCHLGGKHRNRVLFRLTQRTLGLTVEGRQVKTVKQQCINW